MGSRQLAQGASVGREQRAGAALSSVALQWVLHAAVQWLPWVLAKGSSAVLSSWMLMGAASMRAAGACCSACWLHYSFCSPPCALMMGADSLCINHSCWADASHTVTGHYRLGVQWISQMSLQGSCIHISRVAG